MTIETLSPIWGRGVEPLKATAHSPQFMRRNGAPIAQQLLTFLTHEIATWQPDVVIVHERKGTAIVRSLIESSVHHLELPWIKVLSSSALESVPTEYIANKKLLVFDDMMRTGKHLADVSETLRRFGLGNHSDRVRCAVFAKHEESSRHGTIEGHRPHSWFYSDLNTTAFQNIRRQIVEMLQRAGSLMLDTEHIEVRFRLRTGLSRLISALRRRADVMVFRSQADRTNLTVYYGDKGSHTLPPDRFPANTGFTRIVKKCRIVQREGDEFAIIPLCLPSVLSEDTDWPTRQEDCEILGSAVTESKVGRFYGVAMLASLYPLEWILKDLFAADEEIVDLSLPSKGVVGNSGYGLDHLHVMFPTMRIDRLVERISEVADQARIEGRKIRSLHNREASTAEGSVPDITNDELHRNALSLLQAIGCIMDRRSAEGHAVSRCMGLQRHDVPGLRVSEIFAIGTEMFKWEPVRVSTLFDILIDEAHLVTRVEETLDDEGRMRWTRTFKPDGEVVSDLLRRYTTQWGSPHGI